MVQTGFFLQLLYDSKYVIVRLEKGAIVPPLHYGDLPYPIIALNVISESLANSGHSIYFCCIQEGEYVRYYIRRQSKEVVFSILLHFQVKLSQKTFYVVHAILQCLLSYFSFLVMIRVYRMQYY